jgi:uncharacterized protein YraI
MIADRKMLPGAGTMNTRKRLFLGGLCSCMMLPAIAQADEKITTANVDLRSGAGLGYRRVATLPPGRLVAVKTCRNDWCQIKAEDLTGWVLVSRRSP